MFSDESHFEMHGYRSPYTRKSIGEPFRKAHIQQATKHPPKKMFRRIISASGPGRLISIEGMMTSDKYKDILAKYLTPKLSNSSPPEDPVFQQDLAPCHYSKKTQTFLSSQE